MSRRLLFTTAALIINSFGCSSGAESDVDSTRLDAAEPPASDTTDEGFEAVREAELSPEEQDSILGYLGENGVSDADVDFLGRLVALQGDGYFHADELLQDSGFDQLINKGKVPTQLSLGSGFPNCSVATCGATLPVQYAFGTVPPQNLAFRRPDTSKTYYLVVDDNAPSFFTSGAGGGMVGQAATAVENASSTDCMTSTLFTVMRNADFQLLPLDTREANYRIRITNGAFGSVCNGGAVGCSNFPRIANVKVNGSTVSRLRFGDRIALVTVALVQPTTALVALNAYSVGIMTHELLHAMGIGHPQVSGAEERTVPGTASGTTHLSIMHADTINNANYRDTLQSDDRAVFNKLYSGSCTYSDSFRTITP